ncbi:MAG: nucleotide exchange factor GrpE [Clostridiales bacterium]|nr:nucleotide exchange factor GrpE [Clostridiales bacterium]
MPDRKKEALHEEAPLVEPETLQPDPLEEAPAQDADALAKEAAEAPAEPTVEQQLAELGDRYLRLAAEYDNFRKRTARERESQSAFVVCETVAKFLPLLDSLDQAAAHREGDTEAVREGLEKVLQVLRDTLAQLGLAEIDTTGAFDPNLHNAVLHTEDETLPQNTIVDVFQKGYLFGDRVVRHAMVSVAN